MSNTKNHFYEAYIKSKNIFVEECNLIKIFESEKERFYREYKDKMFCPECKQAQLEVEFGQIIKCLRTLKGQKHDENCPNAPEASIATLKQIQAYIKDTNSQDINNNLWRFLSRLKNSQTGSSIESKVSSDKPNLVFYSKTGEKTQKVHIPQQKIRNENIFEYDITKYYYGHISIEIGNKSQDLKTVQLKLYPNSGTKHIICSLFISKQEENLNPLVDRLINEFVNGQYLIAFFGQMVQKNDQNHYNNLFINHYHHIIIEPITLQKN